MFPGVVASQAEPRASGRSAWTWSHPEKAPAHGQQENPRDDCGVLQGCLGEWDSLFHTLLKDLRGERRDMVARKTNANEERSADWVSSASKGS